MSYSPDAVIKRLRDANTDEAVSKVINDFVAEKNAAKAVITPAVQAVMANGGDMGGQPNVNDVTTKKLGKVANPLFIPQAETKAMHRAAIHGQGYVSTKSAATISSLLPSQLQPGINAPQFETRLLDHLPVMSISAPSLEYLKFGSVTGTPALVTEGSSKPELTLAYTSAVVTPSKIAAWTSATREALTDYEQFLSVIQTELLHRIVSVENNELLVQTGTTGHLNGLINQAGLTHARPSTLTGGVSTETSLDALELSIAAMRAGSELVTPELIVVHPTTFSLIRRLKDGQRRYLFAQADGTSTEVNTLWGIPTLVTTDQPTGKALLINNRFGFVVVREGLNVTVDPYSASTNNISKLIGEERIGLAVERPNALLVVTNLGTEASDA